jgi:hypothetical protein
VLARDDITGEDVRCRLTEAELLGSAVHWVVPSLAGVFLAASMMLIFVSFLNYLVDSYLMYAASAIAANTVVRSAAGSAAPLFTNQMFTKLGVGGGGSLIGGVGALLAIIPFAFVKYGEGIRIRSRFAPTDARPPRQDDEEKGQPDREARGDGELRGTETQTLEGIRKEDERGAGDTGDLDLDSASTTAAGMSDGETARDEDKKARQPSDPREYQGRLVEPVEKEEH